MIFEAQHTDGTTYEVDAPDMQSAVAAVNSQPSKQPQQSGGYLQAAGKGLVEGISGLAGLPGDLSNLVGAGVDWAAKNTLSPEKYQKGKDYKSTLPVSAPLPTSEGIQSKIEGVTGAFPPSQTPGENRVEMAASFAPAMLTGGAGMMKKAATSVLDYAAPLARRFMTNVAAPSAGAEGAKEATEGNPQLQPYATIGGAVVGGILGHHLGNNLAADTLPSGSQIKDAATALYKHPEAQQLRISPQGASDLSTTIQNNLLQNKVDPIAAPNTYKFIEGLKTPRFGPETQIADIDMARQSLGTVPPNETRAAAIARGQIDNYLTNIPPQHITAGNPANVSQIMQDARGNWSSQAREEALNEAMQKASDVASTNNSGRNVNNTTRKAILKTVQNQEGLTQEEVDQARRAWGGTNTGNTARYVANLAGAGGGLGQVIASGMGGYAFGGTPTSGAIGALVPLLVGNVAKHVGDASTRRNAELLSQMLRARSPLAQSMGAIPSIENPQTNALINALIASHSPVGKQ